MTSNPNSSDFNYKDYSLEKLQDWVHDAMSSDASPHEIYSAIREAVREEYYYHKDRISRASGLLELLSGHRPVAKSDLEYGLANSLLTKDRNSNFPKENTICYKDDPSPECKGAWNDFWEENYYPEEHSKHYYDYDRNDANKPNPFVDKVTKWQLPVEADSSGEYFVTFPDDLLEAATLKEGDQIEWVDKGDGSYLLKKVQPSWVKGNELARVKTYNEMIEDGWTMTDDGFWIKEN